MEAFPMAAPAVALSEYESRVLVHFDIPATQESIRRRVDRFLYGGRETKDVGDRRRAYRYPGLLERTGGRHYGQSVVILSPEAADEAIAFFRALKVSCQRIDILCQTGSDR